jgi:hypothetical protein
MRSLVMFRKVGLLMLFAGGVVPACSDDQGPMLLVNVSLDTGVPAPATVQFQVLQGANILTQKDLTWPGGTSANVGLELPKGSTGAVTITANGLSNGALTSSGSATGTVGDQPIALVLKSVPGSDMDAGTSESEAGVAPVDSQPVDGAGHDLAQAVDLAVPDQTSFEAGTPGDGGDLDVPVVDAGVPDAFNDTAADAPIVLDTAPTAVDSNAVVDGAGATRSWSTPLNVSGDYLGTPSVAVQPKSGDAIVVWGNATYGVTAVCYTAATDTWGKKVTVSDGLNLTLAQVAVDAKGHAIVVWSKSGANDSDTTGPGIWGSFSSDGATWSKPTQIFAGGAKNWEASVQVAMNRAGQAQVVWDYYQAWDTTTQHELYTAYVEGTVIQPAQKLTTCGASECSAHAAIDGNGNGIVVWSQPDTVVKKDSVWGATFAKQTFGTPQLLESLDTDDTSNPTVAMNTAGQGMVVWQQPAGSSATDIYSRRYSVSGGWADSERVTRNSGWPGNTMSLALDSFGTAVLAWSKSSVGYQATFSWEAYGSTWDTLGLETDDLASSYYTSTELDPQIAIDGSDNVLFGWRKQITHTQYTPHFRWRTNNTWGSDTELGVIDDLFASNIRLGVTDDGRAVAAWTYYHCDPNYSHADIICPTAKSWDDLSAASKAAYEAVFVSVYR